MADIASGDQRKKNCVSVRVMNSRGLDHFFYVLKFLNLILAFLLVVLIGFGLSYIG